MHGRTVGVVAYESWASSASASASMRANKGRNTVPELRIRRAIHAAGARYRVHYPVPGLPRRTIDIAFPAKRLALFVDGCYWHGCEEHRGLPATNREFWQEKIRATRARDLETDDHLRSIGWTPVRFWEHDPVEDVVRAILGCLAVKHGVGTPFRSK